jgi:hypothetical protein
VFEWAEQELIHSQFFNMEATTVEVTAVRVAPDLEEDPLI